VKAGALIAKVNAVLNKVNATDRDLYKRVYTRSGGDALLGRAGTVTTTDTLITVPPAVQTIASDSIQYLNGSGLAQVGDLLITLSATAISLDDLQNEDLRLVLKRGLVEEELAIIHYDPAVFDGARVAYTLLARSKKR
jgi:hypothetical protein